MALNDVYQVRSVCYTTTQVAVNVRHYRVTAEAPPVPSAAIIAGQNGAAFAAAYTPVLVVLARFRGIGVQKVAPAPPLLEGTDILNDAPGTFPGEGLPKQVAGLITFRTPFAGRAFRGRLYAPFPSEDANTAVAVPSAPYLALLDALRLHYMASINAIAGGGNITMTPCIFHRSTATFTDINSSLIRTVWATQRRRSDFGRPNTLPF